MRLGPVKEVSGGLRLQLLTRLAANPDSILLSGDSVAAGAQSLGAVNLANETLQTSQQDSSAKAAAQTWHSRKSENRDICYTRNPLYLEGHLVTIHDGMSSNGCPAGTVKGGQESALADNSEAGLLVVKTCQVLLTRTQGH